MTPLSFKRLGHGYWEARRGAHKYRIEPVAWDGSRTLYTAAVRCTPGGQVVAEIKTVRGLCVAKAWCTSKAGDLAIADGRRGSGRAAR